MTARPHDSDDVIEGVVDALVMVTTGHALVCDCPVCDSLHDTLHGAVLVAQHSLEAHDDED